MIAANGPIGSFKAHTSRPALSPNLCEVCSLAEICGGVGAPTVERPELAGRGPDRLSIAERGVVRHPALASASRGQRPCLIRPSTVSLLTIMIFSTLICLSSTSTTALPRPGISTPSTIGVPSSTSLATATMA